MDWVWNSRFTHWWFKKDRETAGGEHQVNPEFTGIVSDKEIAATIRKFKKAHINAVLTHGTIFLVRFHEEGKAKKVIQATKKIVDACHNEGIRVVHHMTAGFATQDLGKIKHKEWLNIDARTGDYAYLFWPGTGGWYWYCVNNPDFRRHYFRLAAEFQKGTGVDGFMVDEVYFRTGWHNCGCQHCRRKFKKRTGHSLPKGDDPFFWANFDNPAFRAWLRFRCESVGDFYQDLYKELKKADPSQVLLGCKNQEENQSHSQYYGDHNVERMRGVNLLFLETWHHTTILHDWQRTAVTLRLYGALSSSYGTPTLVLMRNLNRDDAFFGWALRSAHGMRTWAISTGGMLGPLLHVTRSAETMSLYQNVFGWDEEHEEELSRSIFPFSNIAVLFSGSTRDMYMGDHADYHVKEWAGWCRALLQENIQFEVIVEPDLRMEALENYDLLILPNAACLSKKQCAAIRQFAKRGGSLILTHETSLFDETGKKRRDFALKDLTGLSYVKTVSGTHLALDFDSPLEKKARGRESAARSYRTDYESASQVFFTPDGDASVIGTTSFNFGPKPAVVSGRRGRSRWVYLGHKPGFMYRPPDRVAGRAPARPQFPQDQRRLQGKLMIDCVRWALRDRFNLVTRGVPEGVMVKAFRQKSGRGAVVIHLLNCLGASRDLMEPIPKKHTVTFPKISKDMVIELRTRSVKEAFMISPDWKGKRTVRHRKVRGGSRFTIPAGHLKRYAVLVVT